MSSNIRIKKVCQHCGKLFIAKTTVTQFCSDDCAKKNYKKRQREDKIQVSNQITSSQVEDRLKGVSESKNKVELVAKSLIDIEELSAITYLSRRTLFRLMEDKNFPKLKVGRCLLFRKDEVINYLTIKFQGK